MIASIRYKDARDGSLHNVPDVWRVQHIEGAGHYQFSLGTPQATRDTLVIDAQDVIPVSDHLYVVTRDLTSELSHKLHECDLNEPLLASRCSSTCKVPIIEEQPIVMHMTRESGRMIVEKKVEVFTQHVSIQEAHQEVVVERRSCGRILDEGEDASHYEMEDGTLVIPVVEERVVTHIERVVVEELIVRKRTRTLPVSREVELRRAHMEIRHESA